jgi:23S rRNA pseudouridine1911/1915/1917 synthase
VSKPVTEAESGERLDRWLVSRGVASSRNKAARAVSSGKVTVDDAVVTEPGHRLQAGASVQVDWARPGTARGHQRQQRRMERAGVELLLVDDHLAVANKPAGLLTDTATRAQRRSRDSLRKQVAARLGGPVWPAHRIDRDTTGVVAFARSEALAERLRAQWHARTPERVYLAVLEGVVQGEGGTWSDWMAWDAERRLQCPSTEGAPHAVLAQAHWSVQRRHPDATVVQVRLVSGRRNQIRVHAMLRGHPLVGETQYRRRPSKGPSARRQLLHAVHLGFVHPVTGEPVRIDCPVPRDMARWLR